MLIFAGNTGSAYGGMAVMFIFSIGLGVSYLLIGIALGRTLGILEKLQKYQKVMSYITGTILLVFGVVLLLNKFTPIVEILYRFILYRMPIGM